MPSPDPPAQPPSEPPPAQAGPPAPPSAGARLGLAAEAAKDPDPRSSAKLQEELEGLEQIATAARTPPGAATTPDQD